MDVDTSRWSGDGDFTARLVEVLVGFDAIRALRVEDAPASRAESGYNFLSNEVFVAFDEVSRVERRRRWLVVPVARAIAEPRMTLADLSAALGAIDAIGAPDYEDEGMLQYLRTDRIVSPYQTRGIKIVELVRIYRAGQAPRR